MLIAFHKPFGVLSQFTGDLPRQCASTAGGSANRTLAEFGFPKNVYPIGRLDADSEGLLLLSDEPEWNARILTPRNAHEREYWVQVERIPTKEALEQLAAGVLVQGRKTLRSRAWLLAPQPQIADDKVPCLRHSLKQVAIPPTTGRVAFHRTPNALAGALTAADSVPAKIPPRNPPIRFRKNVPDCWLGLELIEGKNRQVRRMTAAIGHPTLRLLRVRIGGITLGRLRPGEWHQLTPAERNLAAGI